jgi:hypothetical protein
MVNGFMKATITQEGDDIGVHVDIKDLTDTEQLAAIGCLASDLILMGDVTLEEILENIKIVYEGGY